MSPCRPLQRMRVLSPRPSRPTIPSCRTTKVAASAVSQCQPMMISNTVDNDSLYETLVSLTCRYVLTTLSELETESDTTEATKPIKARRSSQSASWSCLDGARMALSRVLYCCGKRLIDRQPQVVLEQTHCTG